MPKIGWVLGSVATLGIGVAIGVALASKPPPRKAPPKVGTPGAVDCEKLEKRLRRCALHVAASLEPGFSEKLAKLPPDLKTVVARTIRDGFTGRVGGACRRTRGWPKQARPINECLKMANALQTQKCAMAPCTPAQASEVCGVFSVCVRKHLRAAAKKKKKGRMK